MIKALPPMLSLQTEKESYRPLIIEIEANDPSEHPLSIQHVEICDDEDTPSTATPLKITQDPDNTVLSGTSPSNMRGGTDSDLSVKDDPQISVIHTDPHVSDQNLSNAVASLSLVDSM